MMMLLSSIALFVDAGRGGDGSRSGGAGRGRGNSRPEFPSGSLTSSAWEGWWHDDDATPPAEGGLN